MPDTSFESRPSNLRGLGVSNISRRSLYLGGTVSGETFVGHNQLSPSILRSSGARGSGSLTGSTTSRFSFFRNIFNHRNSDYRSDAPMTRASRRSAAAESNFRSHSNLPSSQQTANLQEDDVAPSFYQRCCGSFGNSFRPSRRTLELMSGFMYSSFWQLLQVVFTVLLLFGSQVQELWTPKEADVVFDVLFSIALGVFLLDMIIRCFLEPQYFEFSTPKSKTAWGSCRLGSFMFWCDLISSMTLLFDISYVNNRWFATEAVTIQLNQKGMPVRFVLYSS